MPTSFALPGPLREKLSALARHIRRQRVLRGLCLTALVVLLAFAAVFLLDLGLALSQEILAVLLAGILGVAGLMAAATLVWSWAGRLDFAALAALIEKKHPELKERLTSTIEVTGDPKGAHGSELFIAQLLQETEQQTQALVFRQAAPRRLAGRVAAVLLVFAAVALPALVWTSRYADFGERFFLSWLPRPALEFGVAPGDAVVAVNQPWDVTADITTTSMRSPVPESAELVIVGKDGREQRLPMRGLGEDSFAGKIDRVSESFTYYITAGHSASDRFRVKAVSPVQLALDSSRAVVVWPEYVDPVARPKETVPLSAELFAVQFSQIQLDCRFLSPASRASLQVTQQPSGNTNQPARSIWQKPLDLSPDRTQGGVTLPVLEPGHYQLSLHTLAEGNIPNTQDLPVLVIGADEPPLFMPGETWIAGLTRSGLSAEPSAEKHHVAPDDALPLRLLALDREGLGRVELEYRINKGPVQSKLIREARGALVLRLKEQLSLKGLVKTGDQVELRLKAVDNRQLGKARYQDAAGNTVPDRDLKPQESYYPVPTEGTDGWLVLTIDPKAEPLQQREIVNQRDDVHQKIDELTKKLELRKIILQDLHKAGEKEAFFNKARAEELKTLWNDVKDIQQDLDKLAKEAGSVPELGKVAEDIKNVADQELTRGKDDLHDALVQKDTAKERQPKLGQADQEVGQAVAKLKALQQANDQVAQARLDQMKLEQLAGRENDLSKQIKHLENKDLQNDPQAQAKLETMKQEQADIAQKLKQMTGDNSLEQAMQSAQAEQARKLGQKAEELAKAQRDLMGKADQEYQKQLKNLLEEFARKQQALADKAAKLGRDTAAEVKTRDIKPLNAVPPQDATDSLTKGDVVPALGQQKQAEQEMTRVAGDLKRLAYQLDLSLNLSADPRKALQQLVQLQQELEKQLLKEAEDLARKLPYQEKEIYEVLKQVYKGQTKIHQSMQKLSLPQPGQFAQLVLSEARENAHRAVDSMKNFDWFEAHKAMEQTRESLEQMVRMLPEAVENLNPLPNNPDNDKARQLAQKQAGQFDELAGEQKALHDSLQRFLAQPKLEGLSGKDHPLGKFAQDQQDLKQKTNQLMNDLAKLSQNQKDSPEAKKSTDDAASASGQAEKSMKLAQDKTGQGDVPQAKQAGENAANMLEKAAQDAKKVAMVLSQTKPKAPGNEGQMKLDAEAAKSLQESQGKMEQAQKQMNNAQPGQASQSMKQAAEAMQQAAQKMMPQLSPNAKQPNKGLLPPPQGAPGVARGVPDKTGKVWDIRPGELQSSGLATPRPYYGDEYEEAIRDYRLGVKKMQGKQP